MQKHLGVVAITSLLLVACSPVGVKTDPTDTITDSTPDILADTTPDILPDLPPDTSIDTTTSLPEPDVL